MYEPLKKNTALLEKLIGHKEHGIVTAYRYASGSITSPQQLFLAVQESVRDAIDKIPDSYKGENTLKESVISWMEDPSHNGFVNTLLQKPEWMAEFSQSTADEIINTLKKSTEISGLMDSIFKMAAKEGITALSLTADSLCKWIIDVIPPIHSPQKILLLESCIGSEVVVGHFCLLGEPVTLVLLGTVIPTARQIPRTELLFPDRNGIQKLVVQLGMGLRCLLADIGDIQGVAVAAEGVPVVRPGHVVALQPSKAFEHTLGEDDVHIPDFMFLTPDICNSFLPAQV